MIDDQVKEENEGDRKATNTPAYISVKRQFMSSSLDFGIYAYWKHVGAIRIDFFAPRCDTRDKLIRDLFSLIFESRKKFNTVGVISVYAD